jgi:membrane fusion protein, multidrug efflux system
MKHVYNLLWLSVSPLIILNSCKNAGPEAGFGAPVPVNLQEVSEGQATYYDQYPGNVVAMNEVQLRSEVNGFVTDIFFQEGQNVRRGQKLYEIEQAKFQAAYDEADASLEMAKANLDKAESDAGRYNKLGDQGMATKQKVEYAEIDVKNAKSQVAVAKSRVLRAATDLKHAIITSPFDGTIGISMVKKGAFITAGSTQLNTISSDNPIAVEFVISEKEITRFNKIKNSKVSAKDSLFTIVLPDNSIFPYTGVIEFFDRAVDPQTGTLRIRLKFPNPGGLIKAGMSCTVRVRNQNQGKVIMVAQKAVTEQMGEFFVYVVEKDTAYQHKVTLGSTVGDKIIIKSGLNVGEKIVFEGVQKLRDHTAVVQQAPTPAGAPAKK